MGDNTSPILLTDVPQPIATFNKPFELSELVGNLDAIFYMLGYDVFAVNCIEISDGSSNKYVLGQSAETYFAELSLEGSSLFAKANGTGTYLFDIDFKHQNRKFFEQTNGTYAVALPWLGLDADSKVLFSIIGETSKTLRIHYVADDNRAWGYAGGGIREISWFNQLLTYDNIVSMVSLVRQLVNLEYSPEAAGGITVTASAIVPTEVDGDWNLFTDGSPFIPLRIVSRFPANTYPASGYGEKLAELNREASYTELFNCLKVVAKRGQAPVETLDTWQLYSTFMVSTVDNRIAVKLVTLENHHYITSNYNGDSFDIYDIDLDNQFRRSLPTSDFKYNVQIPQLLANPSAGQGFGILHEAEVPENFAIFADNNNPLIVNGDTLQNQEGAWANSLTWANVQSLLQAIIAMEFEGFDVEPPLVSAVEYREALATGFTVTPLIPQTLS